MRADPGRGCGRCRRRDRRPRRSVGGAWGIGIPVGRDSLSMETAVGVKGAQDKRVRAPVSLLVSAAGA